ncbi:DUF5330 domain-containing protein [Rhizobium sp. CAU 1783]
MWFLIKGTFWCSMTLVVLSFFGSQPSEPTAGEQRLEVGDAIAAATGAYQYLSAICVEKPEVCEKGAETLTVLGKRAREGALVAYQLLDSQFADETEEAAKPALAAAEPVEPTTVSDIITTGTVVPSPRPAKGPKPYTPPKP